MNRLVSLAPDITQIAGDGDDDDDAFVTSTYVARLALACATSHPTLRIPVEGLTLPVKDMTFLSSPSFAKEIIAQGGKLDSGQVILSPAYLNMLRGKVLDMIQNNEDGTINAVDVARNQQVSIECVEEYVFAPLLGTTLEMPSKSILIHVPTARARALQFVQVTAMKQKTPCHISDLQQSHFILSRADLDACLQSYGCIVHDSIFIPKTFSVDLHTRLANDGYVRIVTPIRTIMPTDLISTSTIPYTMLSPDLAVTNETLTSWGTTIVTELTRPGGSGMLDISTVVPSELNIDDLDHLVTLYVQKNHTVAWTKYRIDNTILVLHPEKITYARKIMTENLAIPGSTVQSALAATLKHFENDDLAHHYIAGAADLTSLCHQPLPPSQRKHTMVPKSALLTDKMSDLASSFREWFAILQYYSAGIQAVAKTLKKLSNDSETIITALHSDLLIQGAGNHVLSILYHKTRLDLQLDDNDDDADNDDIPDHSHEKTILTQLEQCRDSNTFVELLRTTVPGAYGFACLAPDKKIEKRILAQHKEIAMEQLLGPGGPNSIQLAGACTLCLLSACPKLPAVYISSTSSSLVFSHVVCSLVQLSSTAQTLFDSIQNGTKLFTKSTASIEIAEAFKECMEKKRT